MNLREYLRADFGKNLRPLLIKDKCQICGSTENLHLHHIDRFHNLLMETLEQLQLNELNTDDYNKYELNLITDIMLAKQLRINYKTLCSKCHAKIHAIEKREDKYKEYYYNPFGDYIYIDIDGLLQLNLSPQKLTRFIYISTFIKYNDSKIVSGNYKEKKKNIKSKELMPLLGLKNREYLYTKKQLIEKGLIFFNDDDTININEKYVKKGYLNTSKNSKYVKIFVKGFRNLYNEVSPIKHKLIGNILSLYNIKDQNFLLTNEKTKQFFKNNDTKILSNLNSYCSESLLVKNKKQFIFNPSIIYLGVLDYSLKEKFINTPFSHLVEEND